MSARFAILAAALACATPAMAQSADDLDDLAGTWVWSAEGRTLMVLDLSAGPDGLTGTIQRPSIIAFRGDGRTLAEVQTPIITRDIEDAGDTPSGRLLRYMADTPVGPQQREYHLQTDGRGGATLALSPGPDGPVAALYRPRGPEAATVATDWPQGVNYRPDFGARAPNVELAAIFAADQADRQPGAEIDWGAVQPRDEARRARVRQMMDEGLLHTGQDFYHAATVFQHGEAQEDFLLAHALAMAAQAQGVDAAWIAAATLDRYLMNSGAAQIFGTQYRLLPDGAVSQGDYDDGLVPNAIRSAVGVGRGQAEMEAVQRIQMEAQQSGAD